MNASEVLARARELLIEEDWSPNAHRGPHGPRCAFWAIIDAQDVEDNSRPERSAHSFFKAAIGTDDVIVWNDAQARTFSEVMDAFDRAIALAKERAA